MTNSSYLREASSRATQDKAMRVHTTSRNFVLRIASDPIATISNKLTHQREAARTIATRYNAHEQLADALEQAARVLARRLPKGQTLRGWLSHATTFPQSMGEKWDAEAVQAMLDALDAIGKGATIT